MTTWLLRKATCVKLISLNVESYRGFCHKQATVMDSLSIIMKSDNFHIKCFSNTYYISFILASYQTNAQHGFLKFPQTYIKIS